MAISARLEPKTQMALTRYCKAHGITKTEALERGIRLLVKEETMQHHSAYAAYLRHHDKVTGAKPKAKRKPTTTSRQQKDFLDAKYPA